MTARIPLWRGRTRGPRGVYGGGRVVAWAIVDAADVSMLLAAASPCWRLNSTGYAETGTPKIGTWVPMQRLLLGLEKGDPLESDHINGDRVDNRRCNLRAVTHAQNGQNRKLQGGTSRFRGVALNKRTGRWEAYVRTPERRHHIGTYDLEKDAAQAAADARRVLLPFSNPQREEVCP